MSASALTAGPAAAPRRPDAGAVPARGGARRTERTAAAPPARRDRPADPALRASARAPAGLRPDRRGRRHLHRDPAGSRAGDDGDAARRSWRRATRATPCSPGRSSWPSVVPTQASAGRGRALVLGRDPAAVAGLRRGRAGRDADQPVRAGQPAVHHERLRPRGAQQRASRPCGCSPAGVLVVFAFDFLLKVLRGYFVDTAGRIADVKLASAVFAQVHGPAAGVAAGLGRRVRQRPARVREPARLLHLGLDHGPGRPAVPAAVHRRDLADRRLAGAGAGRRRAAGAGGRAAAAAAAEPVDPRQPARSRAKARDPGRDRSAGWRRSRASAPRAARRAAWERMVAASARSAGISPVLRRARHPRHAASPQIS